jgi:hypothetical protein
MTDPIFRPVSVGMSNTNLAWFNNFGYRVNLINLENNEPIALALPASYARPAISPDGQHFTNDHTLYEINSGSLIPVGTLPDFGRISALKFASGNLLYIAYENGHFIGMDIPSMAVITEFDLPVGGSYNNLSLDPVTGLCGLGSPGNGYVVFNPETGIVLKSIEIAFDCFLYGNTIYSVNHFAMPL